MIVCFDYNCFFKFSKVCINILILFYFIFVLIIKRVKAVAMFI